MVVLDSRVSHIVIVGCSEQLRPLEFSHQFFISRANGIDDLDFLLLFFVNKEREISETGIVSLQLELGLLAFWFTNDVFRLLLLAIT